MNVNIELSKEKINEYNTIKGANTKLWGPKLWDSLFVMILSSYPPIVTNSNKHKKIKKAFINTLSGLRYTLPCSFCRESYEKFYKQLPINNFSDSRINMLYWLYLMKDLVNKKLIKQELEYLTHLYKLYKNKKMSKYEYLLAIKNCFYTKPSPKFSDVLNKYQEYRGICSKKIKKCI